MKKTIFIIITIGIIYLVLSIFKHLYLAKQFSKMKTGSNMYIISPTFDNQEVIPTKYTCDGEDINPPLVIAGIPQNTQSLTLIVEDPDAPGGMWNHWIVYNIDSSINEIKEGEIPKGGIEVTNSFGQKKYGGPCPPPGPPHRYFFRIYAVDTKFDENIQTKKELLQKMENHILKKEEIIGLYSK